jgi:hypothetical protein
LENNDTSNIAIETAITTIAQMDKNDAAYKKNKNYNISRLHELKKAINDYCDVSEKWNMALVFSIGVVIGGAIMFLVK